jgi:hypothetical protein
VVLVLSGCSSQGTVSGKVSLNGKALPGGIVSITDSEGQTRTGGVNKDGTYSVSNLAPGKAVVTVVTMPDRPSVKGANPAAAVPPADFVAIPAKFSDPTQSGLSVEVKAGKQDFDIQMTGETK